MTDSRKGGLGRGLAALIPTGPAAGSGAADRLARLPRPTPAVSRETDSIGAVYREVPIDSVRPNAKQPRQAFDEVAMSELAHSIREFGLMQPVVVREADHGRYELVMGERRWRAAKDAGLDRIPAIVRQTADGAMLRDALLENIHRVQLNPLEEAAAYQQLLEEFEVTHDELADRLGRSRPAVTNTIRLLKLGLDDPGAQEDLAARIVAEGMSVRATEEAVVLARGAAPSRPKPAQRRPIQAPGLQELAERLSDTFDTRVKVELGRRKGRIVVEFGSVDDLERIVALMHRD